MFGNECLGELSYEATTSAILLAGFFLSFLADYTLQRFMLWQSRKNVPAAADTEEPIQTAKAGRISSNSSTASLAAHDLTPDIERSSTLNVLILEAGIVFHSLCKQNIFPVPKPMY